MERFRSRRNEVVAGLVAAAAISGCGAEGQIDIAMDESNVPVYYFRGDCPFVDEDINQQTQFSKKEETVNEEYSTSHTAVDEFELSTTTTSNLIDSANYFRSGSFTTTAKFVIEATGLEVVVKSDSEKVRVDEEALEELIMLPYEVADEIKGPRLRQKLECNYDAAVNGRELEEDRVTFFVPSDYTLCFTSERSISSKPDEDCRFNGISLPSMEFATNWYQPLELKAPHLAIMLASTTDINQVPNIYSDSILHEYAHVIDWMDGAPLRFTKMERYADSAVDSIKKAADKKDVEIPQPIRIVE